MRLDIRTTIIVFIVNSNISMFSHLHFWLTTVGIANNAPTSLHSWSESVLFVRFASTFFTVRKEAVFRLPGTIEELRGSRKLFSAQSTAFFGDIAIIGMRW